jgi:hypothetical protein
MTERDIAQGSLCHPAAGKDLAPVTEVALDAGFATHKHERDRG